MATKFWYTHPDIDPAPGKQPQTATLTLEFSPYNVNWTYNLLTQTYDTYGGQVVQVLGVNIDNLIIEGQLGREGAFGIYRKSGGTDDRYGGPLPSPGWSVRDQSDQFDYSTGRPGLHAMVEFFREYFALVSQGGDADVPGRYLQIPMYLAYDGATSDTGGPWTITPTSFPNFRRANDNFAPMWRVEAQVIEAPISITIRERQAALARLQEAVGYTVRNPFSDPAADPNTNAVAQNTALAKKFQALIPSFSLGELEDMIWQQVSIPSSESIPRAGSSILANSDLLSGEVGLDNDPTSSSTSSNLTRSPNHEP